LGRVGRGDGGRLLKLPGEGGADGGRKVLVIGGGKEKQVEIVLHEKTATEGKGTGFPPWGAAPFRREKQTLRGAGKGGPN